MLGGTETRGSTTFTYGANWEITDSSTEIDLESGEFALLDFDDLPTLVVDNFFAGQETVYIAEEEFPWGGKQTTYFTADGDVLGYGDSWDDDWGSGTTYMNADWEFIGSEWDDDWGSGYQFTVYGSESDDFAYNDFGQHVFTNWEGVEETREFNFKFDQGGNLISGTETMGDGSTITFGANWEIVSETRTVNLESDNIAALTDEQKSDIPDQLLASSGDTYVETNEMPWEDTETTYLTADGVILGYSHAWSDPEYGGSGVSYNDAEWNHLGSMWEDEYGSGYNYTVEAIDDASGTVTGTAGAKYYIETGGHTHKDPEAEGNEQTSTHEFTFDENWNMLGGTEKRGDTETVFGANWEIISQKGDVSALGDALTTEQLADIPTAIQSSLEDAKTCAKEAKYDWGTDTTYYDSAGKVLGYANSSSWDAPGGGSNVNKGYHDADWNWLGGSWADKDASGAVIRSGSNSTVDVMTDGVKTGYVDKGSYREGDEGSKYEWTFSITKNSDGTTTEKMTGGTEVRGTYNDAGELIGTTYTYGEDWAFEGAKADTSNLSTLDLSSLNSLVVTALFGSAEATVKYSTEKFEWNEGFSQTTYYGTDGGILGYSDTWSDDWDGDGTIDSSGQSFMDENWEHIGGSWSDQWGSGSNFTVVNADGTRTESGTSTWKNYEGVEETRKFEFKYDADWNLISGTETSSNGETVTFGANWEVLSVSREINLSSEAITELSESDLAGIPSALHAASGKTYMETVENPWGTVQTYLDSNGQILGYSDAWSDDWDGDGTIDSTGTSYQDADWNHLGSTYDDQWSKGFHHTVESTDESGNKIYIEKGSRTDKMADGSDGETTCNQLYFR